MSGEAGTVTGGAGTWLQQGQHFVTMVSMFCDPHTNPGMMVTELTPSASLVTLPQGAKI